MTKRLLLALCFMTSGCSTLYSVGPNAFVEQPEVLHSDKGHTEFVFRAEPGSYFYLAGDISSRPLKVTNPPELQQTSLPQMGLNFSLPRKFEVGLSGNPIGFWSTDFSYALRTMAKYQLLGNAANEDTVEPHLLSVFTHINWTSVNRSGNQDGVFGPGGYPWKGQATFLGIDGGLSYGYRWSSKMMTYVGASYETFRVDAKAHQDRSATGDYPEADYSFPTTAGNSWTATCGGLFGMRNRFAMYYSYSETRWNQQLNRQHFLSIGISLLDFDRKRPPLEPYR